MVICVTGKIGSGKSTVSRMIAELIGAHIVDVDAVGHEILRRRDIVEKLVRIFGKCILDNGEIDRERLGNIVFRDENSRRELERLVHPEMIRVIEEELGKWKNVVLDCALLERMNLTRLCDVIITIVSDFETSRSRKAHLSDEKFNLIWKSQNDVKPIGYVLRNDRDLNNLKKSVTSLLREIGVV